MGREIHIITVGKLKDKSLEVIEKEYLKRILNPPITLHEVRPSAENKHEEGEALLKKIREICPNGNSYIIAMSEWGKLKNSVDFANWTSLLLERPAKIIFLIAGAEGFSDEVLKLAHEKLSLSLLTFPHKLARIILVEQLYRAQTLRTGHPYHN